MMTPDEIYKLVEEWKEGNIRPPLWEIMRNDLGFSVDMCDEIVDAVEEWLPPENETNSYGWNQCIHLMKDKLRHNPKEKS